MTAEQFTIERALPSDASAIATGILMAVGDEITLDFAGSADRVPLVHEVFTRLAAMEDSQYSYTNSLVARTPDSATAGIIVAYDGARLRELRRQFFAVASNVLHLTIDEATVEDETDGSEIYLDSLAVFPEYRGRHLAERLIAAACEAHKDAGKPVGLLCEHGNDRAHRLYTRLGFKHVGERPFAGVTMHHMQREAAL